VPWTQPSGGSLALRVCLYSVLLGTTIGPYLLYGRATEQRRLALDALTATLALSAWVAAGSLALAIADGLGDHPVRRATIGSVLLLGFLVALWKRRAVWVALSRRPDWVILVAAVAIVLVVSDEVAGGAYVAVSLTPLGLAIVAARDRTVWICVGVLMLGYLIGVASRHSLAELADEGKLGNVVSATLKYPVIAFMLLFLRALFSRFSEGAEEMLLLIRGGAPVLTPALAQAVAVRGGPLLLEPGQAAPTPIRLTPSEIRVVEALAAGDAPKQIAHKQGVALSTVRTHIKHAKRKTGARTLRELAALVARPEWPRLTR
jgi:DNA-binding CsgD family transcriptional regulator